MPFNTSTARSLDTTVALDSAADLLGVSVATVRNWIRAGDLERAGRGLISKDSLDDFRQRIPGNQKLRARANKSRRDSHDHKALLEELLKLADRDDIDGRSLAGRYENALSDAYRNREGIYYTPAGITGRLFRYLPADCAGLSFCDPCCGSGNFIMTAIDHGIAPERIFGYDIDPFAVAVTKKRIFDKTGYTGDNIRCLDFLETSLSCKLPVFDIIFTNPPWGKKLTRSLKADYARALDAGCSTDTSALFFLACLERLNAGGYLGFLLQDAFFNVGSYEAARNKALSLQVRAIVDFDRPFPGLLTRARGVVLRKTKAAKDNIIECTTGGNTHRRTQRSFQDNPKRILNSRTSQQEALAISRLYALPHTTLKGRARWGLGIVTGNNRRFISDRPAPDRIPVYRGSDIHRDHVTGPGAYIPADLSLYQQVAPVELYEAESKLIYRFISGRLVFFHDTQQRYLLNSANLLLTGKDFPLSHEQLCLILNSRVMNWLFRTLFDTHKVLRSDLEALPVHAGYFSRHTGFDENRFSRYLGLEEQADGSFRVRQ